MWKKKQRKGFEKIEKIWTQIKSMKNVENAKRKCINICIYKYIYVYERNMVKGAGLH